MLAFESGDPVLCRRGARPLPERLYCLRCMGWRPHRLRGVHASLAVWRCERCGALQVHCLRSQRLGELPTRRVSRRGLRDRWL